MSVNHSSRVFRTELSVVKAICKEVNTPRALAVALMIENNEWSQLLDLKIEASHYDDHLSFSDDYLVTSILSKNPRLPTGIDKKSVAIDKFYAAEQQCQSSNRRISEYLDDPHTVDRDVRCVVDRTQRIIQDILGPCPSRNDLDFMEENMRFGPGATTSLSGVVTQGKKFSPRYLEATPRVVDYRTFGFPEVWRDSCRDLKIRTSSKLTTVPKNAKTDRVICIEPDLNIFCQLGAGALLRKKLLHFGLDLRTQSNNQHLASLGVELDLCTMDLSAASDTICREAVWLLLPYSWADLLHFSRVDKTSLDGKEIALEKWSSMGNGYTFELETLIFFSVIRGVCECLNTPMDNVIAYGDDLIFPAAALELATRTLTFLGFSVNPEKTFSKGRFRESCGADFFDSHNVRPVFLRSDHHDFETICFLYANNLRRWAHRRNGGNACDGRLLPAWLRCFTAVKPHLRFLVPEGFGDVGFIADFDNATPYISYPKGNGWAGYHFKYRSVRAKERVVSALGSYIAFLSGNPSEFRQGVESLRGHFSAATTKTGYVLTWPNLGPWVSLKDG